MSYKNEFASNNIDLQTILDMVNTLPDTNESGGWTVDDIGYFQYSGEHNGTCSFIKGMTWMEFCDSPFNVGVRDYYDDLQKPFFNYDNDSEDEPYCSVSGPYSILIDPDLADDGDPYNIGYAYIVDGHTYTLESDGS